MSQDLMRAALINYLASRSLRAQPPILLIEEPPVLSLVDMCDIIYNIKDFKLVRSPWDKGGCQKNPGLSIHALMCRLQHMNPPEAK